MSLLFFMNFVGVTNSYAQIRAALCTNTLETKPLRITQKVRVFQRFYFSAIEYTIVKNNREKKRIFKRYRARISFDSISATKKTGVTMGSSQVKGDGYLFTCSIRLSVFNLHPRPLHPS